MVHWKLAVIFNYLIQRVMNIRKKQKFIFADADYPIRNHFVMGLIKEADLKAAQELQNNDSIRSTKDDIIVMSFQTVDKSEKNRVCRQSFLYNKGT